MSTRRKDVRVKKDTGSPIKNFYLRGYNETVRDLVNSNLPQDSFYIHQSLQGTLSSIKGKSTLSSQEVNYLRGCLAGYYDVLITDNMVKYVSSYYRPRIIELLKSYKRDRK